MIRIMFCSLIVHLACVPQLSAHNYSMPRAKGGKSDEQAEAGEDVTEELSTFTDADAPLLVFDAGGKSITIKQVRRLSAPLDERVIDLQTLGVTSHCGAIVWDAGDCPARPVQYLPVQ